MATPVIMPRQGQSVESCIIGKWHKAKGETVAVGDTLFTYETDKATFDEEARVGGVLLDVFFAEGDDVPCLANVCVIGEPGDDPSPFRPDGATTGPAAIAAAEAPVGSDAPASGSASAPAAPVPGAAPGSVAGTGDAELRISPRARNRAERQHADLGQAEGSGPRGRVIERDILRLVDEGKLLTGAAAGMADSTWTGPGTGIGGRATVGDLETAASRPSIPAGEPAAAPASAALPPPSASPSGSEPDYTEEKHSTIRKVIARSMQQSLSTMAQLTLNASFDATRILALRAELKKAREEGLPESLGLALDGAGITLNDILLFAVSRVLRNHRSLNAHYFDDRMVYFRPVHLGLAVDTPRGLMVPTLFHADRLSLAEISREARRLAEACLKGTVRPDDLKGATFTLTNLGTLDVESFTPVINPPQTGILGICGLSARVREAGGVLVPYQAMGLSLTFDHRALDGAPAARFLKDLKKTLEEFPLLLLA